MALTTNLVAYYKLDSNSNDSVGTNNGTDTSISYTSSNAVINNAAQYGGASKILIPSSSDFTGSTTAISIAGWVYNTANWTGVQTLVGKCDNVGNSGTYVRVNIENGVTHATPDGDVHTIIGSTTLSTNTRYYLAMTYDGTTCSLYVNGAKDASDMTFSHAVTPGTGHVGIGELGDLAAQFLAGGMIDEVGWWTRALSSAEITSLYNSGNGFAYPFTATATSLPFKSLLGVGI